MRESSSALARTTMSVFRHFGHEAREGPDVFNRTRLDTQRKQITFGQPANYVNA